MRLKVKDLLAVKGGNISTLSHDLRISYTTASDLYHDRNKQISYTLMEKLCSYFDISLNELFEMDNDALEEGVGTKKFDLVAA